MARIIEHQVKHVVTFLSEQHAVIAFWQVAIQNFLNGGAHHLLGLRILVPVLHQHLRLFFQ